VSLFYTEGLCYIWCSCLFLFVSKLCLILCLNSALLQYLHQELTLLHSLQTSFSEFSSSSDFPRHGNSTGSGVVVAPSDHAVDARFTLSPAAAQEAAYIQQHSVLQRYDQVVQKVFHEAFLVSAVLATGKIRMEEGSVAVMFGTLSAVLGSVPFAASVFSTAHAAARELGKASRKGRYMHIGHLNPTTDPVEASLFARLLARRLTIATESDIKEAAGNEQVKKMGKNSTNISGKITMIRAFLSGASRSVHDAVGAVAGRNVSDGLWGAKAGLQQRGEEEQVHLLALADAKAALEFVLSGALEDALNKPARMLSFLRPTVDRDRGRDAVVEAIVLEVSGKPACSLPHPPAPTVAAAAAAAAAAAKTSKGSSRSTSAAATVAASADAVQAPAAMQSLAPPPPPPPSKEGHTIKYSLADPGAGVDLSNTWLIDKLQALKFPNDLVLLCHKVLVCQEGYANEKRLAKYSENEFNEAYLKSVGIVGKGLIGELIDLHHELRAKHFPSAGSPGPVPPAEQLPVPLVSQEVVLETFSTVESLKEQVRTMAVEQQKHREHLRAHGLTASKGGGGEGGGGKGSGGLQMKQKQKQDNSTGQQEDIALADAVSQLQERLLAVERHNAQLQTALAEVAGATEERLENIEGSMVPRVPGVVGKRSSKC
jgi:hypothetical protein